MNPRNLPPRLHEDLRDLIKVTAQASMSAGLIECSSYGVEVLLAARDFTDAERWHVGELLSGDSDHDLKRYFEKAAGMNRLCIATGDDSHEVIATWEGRLLDLTDVIFEGGAIIDQNYGLCIATYGDDLSQFERLFLSRTWRNFLVMKLDEAGRAFRLAG